MTFDGCQLEEPADASGIRRSPRNLTLRDSSIPKLGEPVHPILQELEAFERCQAEGPPDQGEIDTIRRLLQRDVIRRRLDVIRRRLERLGHGDHYSKACLESQSAGGEAGPWCFVWWPYGRAVVPGRVETPRHSAPRQFLGNGLGRLYGAGSAWR